MRSILIALLTLLALPALPALPLIGQTVTISSQPGQVFMANFGAPLVAVSVYSAEVCSSPGVTVGGSWGQIRQIAEGGGINIVDNVLVPATAQLAQSKTPLHKTMIAVGIIGLSTLFVAATHAPPPWLIEGAATLTGGAQVISSYLASRQAQVQATISAALGALADPTAQFNVSNGACVPSRLFLGQSVKNFSPIRATLPFTATAPLLQFHTSPDSPDTPGYYVVPTPGSSVPSTIHPTTHPTIEPPRIQMEVSGWGELRPEATWEASVSYVSFK